MKQLKLRGLQADGYLIGHEAQSGELAAINLPWPSSKY